MENYSFKVKTNNSNSAKKTYFVAGVVASGNLEVLVESNGKKDEAVFEIKTTAEGYKETWQAVITDIAEEYQSGGLKFYINDSGAVPAVVSLRLRQAIEEISTINN